MDDERLKQINSLSLMHIPNSKIIIVITNSYHILLDPSYFYLYNVP